MDVDMLNEILRHYEKRDDGWAQEFDLTEGQKAYVAGYLACMDKGRGKEAADDMIQDQINNVRSKYCEPILSLLAEEGNLYHGDLADKLELSPSGLNAIIKKMQEAELPLIRTSQIGKYKIYALPDNVRVYMDKKGKGKTQEKPNTKEETGNPFLLLHNFAEKAGDSWREDFCLLLQGEEERYCEELVSEFDALMECIVEIRFQEPEKVDKVRSFLKNEVLLYLLDDYIDSKIQYEQKVKKLLGEEKNARDLKQIKQAVRKMEESP